MNLFLVFFRRMCSHVNQLVKLMHFLSRHWVIHKIMTLQQSQVCGGPRGVRRSVIIIKGFGRKMDELASWRVKAKKTYQLYGKIRIWEVNSPWGGDLRKKSACNGRKQITRKKMALKGHWNINKEGTFWGGLNLFWVINLRILPNTKSKPPYFPKTCCVITVNIDYL